MIKLKDLKVGTYYVGLNDRNNSTIEARWDGTMFAYWTYSMGQWGVSHLPHPDRVTFNYASFTPEREVATPEREIPL